MRCPSRFSVVLCAALLWALPSSSWSAAAPARTTFTNSVGALPAGALPTVRTLRQENLAETLEVEVPLRMRGYPKLLERIGHGETIPEEELEHDHLPLPRDYTMVERWLRDEGFEITQTDPSRLAVFARGTLAQIQHAFQVQMYKVTVKGRQFSAAQTHPSLPTAIASPVLGVNGLQPFRQAHKHLTPAPATGNKPPYLVKEIMGAYGGTSLGYTGAGQTIAILIDSVPLNSDLTSFWTANGIAQSLTHITKVAVNGSTPADTDGEATLDVEWSSSAAPGANIRVYATGDLSFTDIDKGLQRIISDLPAQPTLHQLSISLGLGETYLLGSSEMQTESQYFATIASRGVTVFVASGDAGSNPDDTGHNDANSPGPLQVEYESSDPSVTGVGGTSLRLNASTGAVTSETAWSGSGGGVSRYFSRPSWQTGAGVPTGNMRLAPDVALVASDTTAAYLYFEGKPTGVAGTSWSAPTWAGFAALINEARARHALGSLGLLNPLIYPLIGTANFRDITSGSNGVYSAGNGYDRVTGIGVPNLATLVTTLGGLSTGAPTISGFSPVNGAAGTPVTITGTNLDRTTDVQFGGVSAATFTASSSTTVTAAVPDNAITGPITVVTTTGTISSGASFTVLAGAVANDNFSAAQAISGTSGSVTGANAGATKESGEPDHAGNSGGASVWYAWTAPATGIYTFDTAGSGFDTLLALYTGSAVSALTIVAANDDAGTGVTSAISFAATSGTAYHIAVDGHNGQSGSVKLNWAKNSSAPAINNFVPASGAAGTLVVINGANFTGTQSVTFGGAAAVTFTVVSATQISATVPTRATTGVIGVTTSNGTTASTGVFSVTVPPANDNFAAAQALSGTSGTATGTNVGATKETGEPNHAGNNGGHSVWYRWTASTAKAVTFNTFGSSFDTALAVYTGSSVNALTEVASDDDAGTGFNSAVTFQARAGVTYAVAVDGSNGVVGNVVLNFNANIAVPAIASFTPSTGAIGASVVITGTSFASTNAVSFNGAPANFTVDSDTQVTAVVPANASNGPITVTNPTGSATSTASFALAAGATNDDFADAIPLTDVGTVTGTNAGATKEPNEPNHAGATGGASVWWSFTAPATATYSVTTLGSSFDTVLAVYTGSSLSTLSLTASNDDDPNGGHTSLVTFKATAGTVYKIAVDGFNAAAGDIVLSILADNSGTIFSTGFEATEGYSAGSALGGQNGWLSQGTGANGLVDGYFTGLGQQGYLGSTNTGRPPGVSYVWHPLNYTPVAGDVVTFQVTMQVVDSTNRNYDDFEWQVYNQAGKRLFAVDFDNSKLAIGYVLDSSNTTHATGFQFGDDAPVDLLVTMDFTNNRWSATVDGTVVISNQPISAVGAALNLGDVDAVWNVLGRNAGDNYLLFDNLSVRNTGNTPPKILLQPQAQSASQGTTLSLRTVATGTQPITYQWRKDSQNLPGATDATLVLSNVQPGDAGSYDAVITNAAGTATTDAVAVTVNLVQAPNLQPYRAGEWSDVLVVSGNYLSTTDDSRYVAGEALYAGFGVINSGTVATAASFHSALYIDGVRQSTVTQSALLQPGATGLKTNVSLGSLATGTHELKLVVDADGSITESDEGDNTYTKIITVAPAVDYALITVISEAMAEGTASGGGALAKGSQATVTATANAGYTFVGWKDGTDIVSASAAYTFTVGAARLLVATFESTANLPTISILNPTPGLKTVDSTIALSGTAGGTAGILSVTWRSDQGGAGGATGTAAWSIAAVPLKAGANLITVTALDAAGHSAVATVTIVREALSFFAGTYTGMLTKGVATPSYEGYARLAVTAAGAFSGSVYFHGQRSVLTGRFDAEGQYTRTLARPRLAPLAISLSLTPGDVASMSGTVSDGTTDTAFAGALPAYLAAGHAWGGAPRYTALYQRNESDTTAPRGHGYGLLTVSTKGVVTLRGRLADGSAISYGGFVNPGDTVPFYAALYAGRGFAAGPLTFASSATGDLAGPVDWSKPALGAGAAFQTRLTVVGSAYTPTRLGVASLATGDRNGELGDAGLGSSPLAKTLSLSSTNAFVVTPAATDRLRLSIVRTTGQITGSFIDPLTHRAVAVQGVMLQTPDTGGGYFLDSAGSGYLKIEAAR